MRITNRTLSNNLLHSLNRGLGRLDKLNQQLASGKTVNVPSDDPVKTGTIMRLRSSVRETEQYLRSTNSAISWLDATDVVLQELTSVIHRARELAISGASETSDESARQALADEVAQIYESVIQLGNSSHGGRYLFAGQRTQEQPFELGRANSEGELAPLNFRGGSGDLTYEIGVGARLQINLNGEQVFDPIFGALQQLHAELTNQDGSDNGNDALGMLDSALDNVLTHISQVGAKQNRVELSKERLEDLRLNVTELMSQSEDIDYAETIMYLKTEEFIYRTALSVGARIIQPSLVDFLN